MAVTSGRTDVSRQRRERDLLELLHAQGPLRRSALREASGLSHPTVLDLVQRLVADGRIEDLGVGPGGRRGPGARQYGVRARAALAGAAAVGGERIEVAIADLQGEVLARTVVDRRPQDPPTRIAEELLLALASLGAAPTDLVSTVVGTHGLIDRATGDLGYAWDLPEWRHQMLGPLRERLPGTVRLERDVQLVAEAELRTSGRDEPSFGLLWLDRGVGYAGVVEGAPLVGASGAAGQVGYLPVPGAPTSPLPASHDTTSPYIGGLQSLVGLDALQALAGTDAGAPDPMAPAWGTEYAERVALGAASIVAVLDPGTLVLSGCIGIAGGPELARAVGDRLATISPIPVSVRAGRCGAGAVLDGAVACAVRTARDLTWGPR